MIDQLETLKTTNSMPEMQSLLGEILGLETPVSRGVVLHALEDQYYCHNLISCRGHPQLLDSLLTHPKNETLEVAPTQKQKAKNQELSTVELTAKAGSAMYKWAKSGFSRVDDNEFAARFAACESCDKISAAPDTLTYKVTLSRRSDRRICTACGCPVARKARMSSEACPMASLDDPTRNRWGQPMQAKMVTK